MSSYEEFDYNKPISIKVWSRILPYVKRQKKPVWIIIATMLICAGAGCVLPASSAVCHRPYDRP
jgi:hypothetical protein